MEIAELLLQEALVGQVTWNFPACGCQLHFRFVQSFCGVDLQVRWAVPFELPVALVTFSREVRDDFVFIIRRYKRG